MRRPLSFACEGATLAATLDEGVRTTGILIASGGTQTRIGAHRGMALLAAALSERGFAVLRYDRRGVGDSDGHDPGFAASGFDLAAAAAAFRAECPHLRRIAGFGLCDGATALALHHRHAGIDALLLANPWVVEPQAGLPPAAAIRSRYIEKLTSIAGWRQLLTGRIDLRKLARGIKAARQPQDDRLAGTVAQALRRGSGPLTLILARGDATAIAFDDALRSPAYAPVRERASVRVHPGDSHSFARPDERAWLTQTLLAELEVLDRAL